MSDRLEQLDYYTLLGISEGASVDEIQNAFHRFALKFHPDRHVGESERKTQRAALIFRRGAEAYRVLSQHELRAEYDQGLRTGQLRLEVAEPKGRTGPSRAARTSMPPMPLRARPLLKKALEQEKAGQKKAALLNARIAASYAPEHPELVSLLERLES